MNWFGNSPQGGSNGPGNGVGGSVGWPASGALPANQTAGNGGQPQEDRGPSENELQQVIDDLRAENAALKGRSVTLVTILHKNIATPAHVSMENASIGSEVVIQDHSQINGRGGLIVDVQSNRCTVQFEDGTSKVFKIPHQNGMPSPLGLIQPTIVVQVEGAQKEMVIPKAQFDTLAPGDVVKMTGAGGIIGTSEYRGAGPVASVLRILPDGRAEVEVQGNRIAVRTGNTQPADGHFVVLDPTSQVITTDLGKENKKLYMTDNTNVSWDQVGGLEEQKREVMEAVVGFSANRELYEFYGQRPVKGILLYGPPGNGKTLLAKAAASAIAGQYQGEGAEPGIIVVDSPALLDKFVGSTEAAIRNIFATAREFYERTGTPCVIFFDEFDALGQKRGSGISSDVNKTIVPQLLTELDGMKDGKFLVMFATNRPDILDGALVRDGRIDRKIKISRPNQEAAEKIIGVHLARTPVAGDRGEVAKQICAELFSHKYPLVGISLTSGRQDQLHLRDTVSGAMLAGIVQRAVSGVIRRLAESKGDPVPLQIEDFMKALGEVYKENVGMQHIEAVQEMAEAKGYAQMVNGVSPIRAGR